MKLTSGIWSNKENKRCKFEWQVILEVEMDILGQFFLHLDLSEVSFLQTLILKMYSKFRTNQVESKNYFSLLKFSFWPMPKTFWTTPKQFGQYKKIGQVLDLQKNMVFTHWHSLTGFFTDVTHYWVLGLPWRYNSEALPFIYNQYAVLWT